MTLLTLIAASGCQKAKVEDDTTSTTVVNVGVVDEEAGMYMRLIPNEKSEAYIHESSSFTSECAIKSSSSEKDIECLVDAPEEDLHFNGYSFQINVPSAMCDYVTFEPYYYYKLEPGQGPQLLQYSTDATGAPQNIVFVDGDGTTTHPVTLPNTATCAYDYSSIDGPNCCTGKFTTLITDSAGTLTTQVTEWGGKATNCLSGPAMDTQTLSKSGYPARDVYFVDDVGMNIEYQVASPLSKGMGSNIYAANFFDSADHGGGTSIPMAMRAQYTGSTLVGLSTQPYFELICMDRAFEVQARIRTSVREWNEYSEFKDKGDPDTGEPSDTEDDYDDQYLNDRYDWRNVANGYPGE